MRKYFVFASKTFPNIFPLQANFFLVQNHPFQAFFVSKTYIIHVKIISGIADASVKNASFFLHAPLGEPTHQVWNLGNQVYGNCEFNSWVSILQRASKYFETVSQSSHIYKLLSNPKLKGYISENFHFENEKLFYFWGSNININSIHFSNFR